MIFRQLYDADSSTYTYLIADEETRQAVLIDPVREQVERDLGQLRDLNLALTYVLDTHTHADHVTAAGRLRARTGATTVAGPYYRGRTVSTIGEEKRFNARVANRSCEEFVEVMGALNLPKPKKLDEAVPANRACGMQKAAQRWAP
jgi:glyoxylase-like metal-dependent hydrolase (beta-lactamase superfamily II)